MDVRARGLVPMLVAAAALVLGGCVIEGELGRDAPAPTAASPTGSPGATVVPIRVIGAGGTTTVLVPVRVNGQGPFDFVLDTGASASSVNSAFARRMELPRTGETERVSGVTGSTRAPVVRVEEWSLGGRTLHREEMVMINLGIPRVNGLLGSDELRRFGRISIDYSAQRLILHG